MLEIALVVIAIALLPVALQVVGWFFWSMVGVLFAVSDALKWLFRTGKGAATLAALFLVPLIIHQAASAGYTPGQIIVVSVIGLYALAVCLRVRADKAYKRQQDTTHSGGLPANYCRIVNND